ncbi:uncharacterized protein PV09_05640 [Verruconis gallopava]|uniref:Uncharacterized protein n=1 Tax=Verruconis gallopava TaxID=253628 RepID=A0A0D2AV13_9PEZI|nr:uncharacterized protein PV09_05640 [Verruconis gallopava]KIW02979.1 hypothetical protein PV09_05640 [Verruconis gallopava]
MGQEASQMSTLDHTRPGPTSQHLNGVVARSNGWTSVNGSDRPPSPTLPHPQAHSVTLKRKRTSKTEIRMENISRKNVELRGAEKATKASKLRQKDSNEHAASHESDVIKTGSPYRAVSNDESGVSAVRKSSTDSISSLDSVLAPSNIAATKNEDKSAGQNGDYNGNDSESDVDTDALGLLQRVAAAQSDDDEESVTETPAKSQPVQPSSHAPTPYGWKPPQPTVATHYTIYSPHAQPPSYVQTRSGPENFDPNAPLTAHEEAQLRDEGRFTKMEQSFLKDAIDEYCKKHNISVELANDYVCGKAREGNIPGDFWDEVCKALPQRTKNSIQRAAKRVFRNNQKKGPWTEEEEKALAEAYAKAPDQWAKICEEVPGRSAEQCRDRWRNYTQNGCKLTRGPWTDAEEAQFVEICKQMLAQARVERENQRRQGRTVSEKFEPIDHLNFTAISAFMKGSRSRLHCRNKWHKLKKRPDVEAAIQAVMRGESPLPTTSAQDKPITSVSLPSISTTATYGPTTMTHPPLAQGRTQASMPSHLPTARLTSMTPLPSSAHAGPRARSPSLTPASTSQPPVLVTPSNPYHTFRPSPAPGLNQVQGTLSASTPSTLPPLLSAAHHPLPYADQHSTFNAPLTAPPAPSQTGSSTGHPSIASRSSDAHTAPTQSSSPPSWVNAPPRVPQLFAPSQSGPPTSLSAPRAIPGPKRVLPAPTAQNNNAPTSRPVEASFPGISHTTTIGHALPALATSPPPPPPMSNLAKATSAPALLQQHSLLAPTLAAAESLSSLARQPGPLVSSAASGPKTQVSNPSMMSQHTNGNGFEAVKSASPDLPASPSVTDSRPVRKKQKTAKARGDE